MTICKFWQRGDCRYGDSCRFEHPRAGGNSQEPYGSIFYNQTNGKNERAFDKFEHGSKKMHKSDPDDDYKLSYNEIEKDLIDHPIWILSCYGPGKDAPVQLFGGKARELSFEEVRLRYYELFVQGHISEANAAEDKLQSDAKQQMVNVKNDIGGAIQYIISGSRQHPNRIDICSPGFNPISADERTDRNSQAYSFQEDKSSQRFVQNQQVQESTERSAPGELLSDRSLLKSLQPHTFLNQPSNQPSLGQSSKSSPFEKVLFQSLAHERPVQSPFNRSPFSQGISQAPSQSTVHALPPNSGRSTFGRPSNPFTAKAPPSSETFSQASDITTSQRDSRANDVATEQTGILRIFKGRPVAYGSGDSAPYMRRLDGNLQKIWFPKGKSFSKPEELPFERYTPGLQTIFQAAKQARHFEEGQLPELPPRRDWVSFEL